MLSATHHPYLCFNQQHLERVKKLARDKYDHAVAKAKTTGLSSLSKTERSNFKKASDESLTGRGSDARAILKNDK